MRKVMKVTLTYEKGEGGEVVKEMTTLANEGYITKHFVSPKEETWEKGEGCIDKGII